MNLKKLVLTFALIVSGISSVTANAMDRRGCRIRCDLEYTHCTNVICGPAFYFPWIYDECVDSCSASRSSCYSTCSFLPIDPPTQ